MKFLPTEFEGQAIRRVYDEVTDAWWFSVIDVVQVLTQQPDDLTARKYWNQLKRRLDKEGSQRRPTMLAVLTTLGFVPFFSSGTAARVT